MRWKIILDSSGGHSVIMSPYNGKGRRPKSERDVKKLLDTGLADGRGPKDVSNF